MTATMVSAAPDSTGGRDGVDTLPFREPHPGGNNGQPRLQRFPLEPLLKMARGGATDPDSFCALAREIGVDQGFLRRTIREGVTWTLADRWAVAIGYHPGEIWPAWWDCLPDDRQNPYDDALEAIRQEAVRWRREAKRMAIEVSRSAVRW